MIFESIGKNHFNIFFFFFFSSLIIGTAITEVSFLILLIYLTIIKKFELFKVNLLFIFKFCGLIVVYIFLNYLYNYFVKENEVDWLRSFFYFRFIILFFLVTYFLKFNGLKQALIILALIIITLQIDIIFQYFSGYNIIGLKTIHGRPSSFFVDELRAGSFLSRFSIPISFFLYLISNTKISKFFSLFLLLVAFISIYLTGERMALLSFILTILISSVLIKKFRKILIYFLTISIIAFMILLNIDTNNRWSSNSLVEKQNMSFFEKNKLEKNNKVDEVKDKIYTILDSSGHLPLFMTSYNIWSQNKFLGIGTKTFRNVCDIEQYKPSYLFKHGTCSTHPHNHFLEILSELGIIGFILMLALFFIVIFDYIKVLKKTKIQSDEFDYIMMNIFFSNFLGFIFVISSGSFFNNWTSYIFWINLSFMYSIIRKYNNN